MKKVLSLILCTLLILTNISAFAEEVDYCEKYGVGCPDPDEARKEEVVRVTSFAKDISFRNAGANGDNVEFVFKGENWTNASMKMELLLTPLNNSLPEIKQEMITKVVQVTTPLSMDGTILATKHEASTVIDTRENNNENPIEYKIQVLVDGEAVFTSDKLFTIAGKEKNVGSKPVDRQYKWSDSGINVAVDEVKVSFPDQKPLLELNTSRTYIPVRFLAESLGAEVKWNNDYQVVEIFNKYIEGKDTARKHYLKIGENKFVTVQYRDNTFSTIQNMYAFELPQNVAPTLVNGRTMLPFRYVAELLGSQVYYDKNTNTAHCVKRDMSYYNGKTQVLSTVIGDYFVEELKEYRRSWYGSNYDKFGNPINNISFNGTYGDISTWAAFDHLEHPEWKTLDTKGIGHMHQFSNSLPEETAAYDPYARKYFNDQRQWSVNQTVENGVVLGINETIYFKGKKSEGKANEVFTDLSSNWGISAPLNDKVIKIMHIYDEIAYREISRDLINKWDTSIPHSGALSKANLTAIGISIVGEYVYYNAGRS